VSRLWAALIAMALLQALPARAELWGYVDGAGTAHFAEQALDSRYAPVMRQRSEDGDKVLGKTMLRSNLLTWLEFAPEVKAIQPLLRDAERSTGVDAELLKAIIAVESGYRNDLVSPRGAVGLMQITPVTANRYATKAEAKARPVDQRLRDPKHNVLVGARMLADLSRRYGGVDIALAAWNAGEGKVRRAGGKMPAFEETRAHVHMVLELYWALLQQRQQGSAQQMKMVQSGTAAADTLGRP
jgi:soluble lytic murein transglycosylase-like protein